MDRRYLLDTNVVLFALVEQDEISHYVRGFLEDYNNLFYVSVVSIQEIALLVNGGKFHKVWKTAAEVLPAVEATNYQLLPLKREHIITYTSLQHVQGHNDPFDHTIISQAISERMTLISSDHKFKDYANQKLTLIFNKR
ncbi:twitching motility protein PilT [Bacteroidia bacterium]|nr:twitching motility protein PilT [Bacteroidia bacterium]